MTVRSEVGLAAETETGGGEGAVDWTRSRLIGTEYVRYLIKLEVYSISAPIATASLLHNHVSNESQMQLQGP